jgi:hypothetical protein
MSDDIEIMHGRVVAVDTDSLRHVAADIAALEARIEDAGASLRIAGGLLGDVEAGLRVEGVWARLPLREAAESLAVMVRRDADEARDLDRSLRHAAAKYEYVDLCTRRSLATDDASRAVIDARLAALRAEDPGVLAAAAWLLVGYELRMPWEVIGDAPVVGSAFGPMGATWAGITAFIFGIVVRDAGLGTVPSTARLTGPVEPVVVQRTSHGPGTPVTSLQQAVKRVPKDVSIRVERYSMPGGARQFVVYLAGTGSGSAFDWPADFDAYGNRQTAAYGAVREALQRAGAQPGDVVHAIGHSQGGMIAGRMALEHEYDVKTLITLGSPIQADVPDSVLSVELRHANDTVSALAAGGTAGGVGSPDSMVVERTPVVGLPTLDNPLPAHAIGEYADTAGMVDSSKDPRIDAVRDVFAELGHATSVDVTEYSADRPGAPGAGAGRARAR